MDRLVLLHEEDDIKKEPPTGGFLISRLLLCHRNSLPLSLTGHLDSRSSELICPAHRLYNRLAKINVPNLVYLTYSEIIPYAKHQRTRMAAGVLNSMASTDTCRALPVLRGSLEVWLITKASSAESFGHDLRPPRRITPA